MHKLIISLNRKVNNNKTLYRVMIECIDLNEQEQKQIREFLEKRNYEFTFLNGQTIFAENIISANTMLHQLSDLEANGFTWI